MSFHLTFPYNIFCKNTTVIWTICDNIAKDGTVWSTVGVNGDSSREKPFWLSLGVKLHVKCSNTFTLIRENSPSRDCLNFNQQKKLKWWWIIKEENPWYKVVFFGFEEFYHKEDSRVCSCFQAEMLQNREEFNGLLPDVCIQGIQQRHYLYTYLEAYIYYHILLFQ